MKPNIRAPRMGAAIKQIMAIIGIAMALLPTAAVQAQSGSAHPGSRISTSQHPIDAGDVDTWLDGFFGFALPRGDVAGAVVVVVKDGKILTQRGFGYADTKARRAVDPDRTLFRVGSVSKLFTWTAVMQLVEQGKIDLDADINRYLDIRIPAFQGRPITMSNLMTHTGGFEESLRYPNTQGKPPEPLGVVVKNHVPRRIYAAGDVPAYSNYGTALAGYIVERVSGERFDQYVATHIFGPLAMQRSSFQQPLPGHLRPFMANGYDAGSGPPQPFEIISMTPAGALSATGADMAKFMIAHLQGGAGILKAATARQMHSTQTTLLPRIDRMALGFYTEDVNGRSVIAHAGDTRYFHSNLWLFPNEGVGIFIAMNASGHERIVTPIRNLLLQQFADRYFPGRATSGEVDPATARLHAKMMEGYYAGSRRPDSSFLRGMAILGQLRVKATAKGHLTISSDRSVSGSPREWIEIAPFLWRASDSGDLIEARVVNGKIERFSNYPFQAQLPVHWTISAAWLMPALQATIAILMLTILAWPFTAAMRRCYGVPRQWAARERRDFLLTRAAAIATLLIVFGWSYAFAGQPFYDLVNGSSDGLTLILQMATPVVALLLLGSVTLNMWGAWRHARSRGARIWSIALLGATGVILWSVTVFNLYGVSNSY